MKYNAKPKPFNLKIGLTTLVKLGISTIKLKAAKFDEK